MNFKNINRKIIKMFIFGVFIISVMLIAIDIREFTKSILTFNYEYLPIIILLTVLNYFIRFVKWEYYLRQTHINISKKESLKIFFSAFPMGITPGKVGELLKSYILKVKYKIPMSITTPMIIIDRLTDAIGIIILAIIGVLVFDFGFIVLLFALIILIVFLITTQIKIVWTWIIKIIKNISILNKYSTTLENLFKSANNLLRLKPLMIGTFIGILAWVSEGLIIYFVIKASDSMTSVLYAIFILAFTSIIGVVSMIPGGIVASEGSMLALLLRIGINKGSASFIIVIIRLLTLWISVIIGSISLFIIEKELNKLNYNEESEYEITKKEMFFELSEEINKEDN